MKNQNFEEFITSLKNCRDTKELLEHLTGGNALMNYNICLIKRDDTQEGFNEHFKKQIALRDFLTEWIEDNEGFFIDEDIRYLIDLIRVTQKYLVDKDNKGLLTTLQKPSPTQRLNSTKRYQDSVRTHLESVKRDLEEICPQGAKTQSLLNSINEALKDMGSIVPIVKIPKANTDELTNYLTYLENETEITKQATRKYKEFFKGYYNLHIDKNFRFSPNTTHITS